MNFGSLLPERTLPWPGNRIPHTTSVVQVKDGLYAVYTNEGTLQTVAFCAGGRVVATLRLTPRGEVVGRYDTYGSGQEYQICAGRTFLEDFGGRVEGPGYPTTIAFETWVTARLKELIALEPEKGSYRPDPKVFLNLPPQRFLGQDAIRCATGSASSTGFFPCCFAYSLGRTEDPSTLSEAAAQLYLKEPLIEHLSSSSQVTGFPPTLKYEREFSRAMDAEMDLFVSVFHRDHSGIVVVGLCAYADRGFAQEGVLGCQKLFLQGLVFASGLAQR